MASENLLTRRDLMIVVAVVIVWIVFALAIVVRSTIGPKRINRRPQRFERIVRVAETLLGERSP